MNSMSLVNNQLDKLAHYVSRITAAKLLGVQFYPKFNIMLTERAESSWT